MNGKLYEKYNELQIEYGLASAKKAESVDILAHQLIEMISTLISHPESNEANRLTLSAHQAALLAKSINRKEEKDRDLWVAKLLKIIQDAHIKYSIFFEDSDLKTKLANIVKFNSIAKSIPLLDENIVAGNPDLEHYNAIFIELQKKFREAGRGDAS